MPIEKPESKKSVPDGLWMKCRKCEEIIYNKELEENLMVCPKCDYHFRISARKRLDLILDPDSFIELETSLQSSDPLNFVAMEKYTEGLQKAGEKSNLSEAVICGEGKIGKHSAVIAVLDFSFMGGSMGSVVGEKVTCMIEHAIRKKIPLVIISASGGARMQEGILSLMQMAKTSAALEKLANAGLPYISVLTDPTTGGVTASFAMLGDVIISEPKAMIGFAGPRVIEQTIKEKLPDDFQKAEFLLEHGLIDMIIERKELKKTLVKLIEFLKRRKSKTHKINDV